MRRTWTILWVCCLFLSACGGEDVIGPTVTSNPDNSLTSTKTTTAPPTIAPSITPLPTEILISGSRLQPNFLEDPNVACSLVQYKALTCLDQKGWHTYDLTDPKSPIYGLTAITHCSDGGIYLAIRDQVFKLEENTLIDMNFDNPENVHGIYCGGAHEIWVLGNSSVSFFDGMKWVRSTAKDIFGENADFFYGLATGPDGRAWVSAWVRVGESGSTSIAFFDDAGWHTNNGYLSLYPDASLGALVVDPTGALWSLPSYKLLRFDGEAWSYFDLPGYQVLCAAFDRQNKIWLGTDFGLRVLDPGTGDQIGGYWEKVKCDFSDNAMQFDRQGRLWIAAEYGFDIYDGTQSWTAYYRPGYDQPLDTTFRMIVLGDGPQSSDLVLKIPNTIRGKLLHADSTPSAGTVVGICGEELKDLYYGENPCKDLLLNFQILTQADGSFEFTQIPTGTYYLIVQKNSNSWYVLRKIEVNPGADTLLEEVAIP